MKFSRMLLLLALMCMTVNVIHAQGADKDAEVVEDDKEAVTEEPTPAPVDEPAGNDDKDAAADEEDKNAAVEPEATDATADVEEENDKNAAADAEEEDNEADVETEVTDADADVEEEDKDADVDAVADIEDDKDAGDKDQVDEPIGSAGCPSVGANFTCEECLESGCAVAVNQCLSGCDVIADAPCWDLASPGNANSTAEELCMMIAEREADVEICNGEDLTDCETCTSTVLSDGESVCSWYTVLGDTTNGFCSTGGCDMMGNCPVGTCDASGPGEEVTAGGGPCNGFADCEPCLNSRMDCAWIANSCQLNCDMIADAACYHPANFPNMTGPEICAIAAEPVDSPTDGGMDTEDDAMEEAPETDASEEAPAGTSDAQTETASTEAISASSQLVYGAVAALSAASALFLTV